ncbi:MAG: inositol monophosphatase family protein [Henriciella sp.]|nr:inositol monophosphatase family protein [Henriciella sp.]
MPDPSSLLKLEQIVDRASQIGRRWSRNSADLTLDEKSAGQFASNADLEIEQALRQALQQAFPDQAIIGEELGGHLSPDQSGWAIDPIDGTSNFVVGLPIWGISIGYIHDGKSVLGAISLPDLNLTLSAATGQGLHLNGVQTRGARQHPAVKVMAIGENDFETGPQTDARAQHFRDRGFSVVRYRCAVFSLAMSALGRLSGYVEHGCGLWDIAAAEVICREAGLSVNTARIADGRYAIEAVWPD